MENYDKYKDEILAGLREGNTAKQIKENLPFELKTLYKIINRLIEMGEITKIEIDIARDPEIMIILEGLRNGKSAKEIKKDVTCSMHKVYEIIDKLIESGIISREETAITTRINHSQREEYKRIILMRLKEGKTVKQIKETLPISMRLIYTIRRELIEAGEIDKNDIKEAKDPNVEIILSGLREGKSEEEINENVTCGLDVVYRIIDRLIEIGRITKEEIKIAREKRDLARQNLKRRYLEKVLSGLREGKSEEEIEEDVQCEIDEVYRLIDELIEIGRITKEEIEIAREKNDKQRRDIEIVLAGLREGNTIKQIKEKASLTLNQVHGIIDKLIEEGKITQIEIDEARNPNIKIVLQGLRNGKRAKEIEKEVTCGIEEVHRLINKLIAKGRITKEEIEIAREKNDITKQRYTQIVLAGLREGKTKIEIKEGLNLSGEKVKKIIDRLVEEGVISRVEIRQAKAKRKLEAEKRILKLFKLGFTEQEIRTIIDINKDLFERRMREIMNKKQITQDEISSAYINRERDAERRKKSIIEGFQNKKEVEVSLIEEYIEYTTAKAHLESLEYSETELLGQVIVRDAKFVTLSNVNIMLTSYTRNNAHERAIEFIDECVGVIGEDSNETAILRRAKQEIEANLERRKEGEKNKSESQPRRKKETLVRQAGGLEH